MESSISSANSADHSASIASQNVVGPRQPAPAPRVRSKLHPTWRSRCGQAAIGLSTLLVWHCAPAKKIPPATALDLAGASEVPPRDEAEATVLARLSQIPPETAVRVTSRHLVASQPFDAASGRTCRALDWTVAQTSEPIAAPRLACTTDNVAWFYVPDVLSGAEGLAAPISASQPSRQGIGRLDARRAPAAPPQSLPAVAAPP